MQEAEIIDRFGGRIGPPTPRPDRGDLLTVLRHLGATDDDPSAGTCGEELNSWGTVTHCIREAGHPVTAEDPHRNRYGTCWYLAERGGR
jgi:hypothetical protein